MGMARLPSSSYENVQIDADTWHTATSAWYTVDAYGQGQRRCDGRQKSRFRVFRWRTGRIHGTPETLTYVQEAEGRNEWKITDGRNDRCLPESAEQMKVGEKTDLRAADAGDTLIFTMADGSTWTLDLKTAIWCGTAAANAATEGWKAVREVLKEALAGEGMQ